MLRLRLMKNELNNIYKKFLLKYLKLKLFIHQQKNYINNIKINNY